MFEYQGNRNQSQSRNRSFQGNQFNKEGPYSRLNQSRPNEPPVNSEELHQNDDPTDGVDYSFSHMSVRERKKLFQQNQNTSSFGSRNPIGLQNRGIYAHETMSDIGDTQVWRSKANTWAPRPPIANNQSSIHSPQLSPHALRNENRGSSVLTFEPQMTGSVHGRSRTLDSASYRHAEQNRFNFENDPMTKSAAFFNPRPDYSTPHFNRQVSGPCTRVIPSRAGSSLTNNHPQTVYHRQMESEYDSYFEKSRVSSPHADRYRSQVHIPLAMSAGGRNVNPSFNWSNPRQSRSQQPLRVNVYSNHDRSADGRGHVYIPINPYASTSVSPNRLYNETVYYAYPANSGHYPMLNRNHMRSSGYHYDTHRIIPHPNQHTTQFRTFHQRPQAPQNTPNHGLYQPMKVKTTPMSQWVPGPEKIRERTPMPVKPENKFWTSASGGQTQPRRNVSAQRIIQPQPLASAAMSPLPNVTRRTSNGAFFDEEAGISEF